MKTVYVVACAAEPAGQLATLVAAGHRRDWDMHVVATPSALEFVDVDALESATLYSVRSQYRKAIEPRPARADGVIVAPATFDVMCKVAAGIADTYALDLLSESIALGTPTVFVPYVSAAQSRRLPFRRGVDQLRAEGARVLLGPDGFAYSDHRRDGGFEFSYPWQSAANELADAIDTDEIVPTYPPC